MVKLTDIQMLLTRRFGSIATNGRYYPDLGASHK